jgi:peptidoglycan/LPS O-acetylase OafA/YrhL
MLFVITIAAYFLYTPVEQEGLPSSAFAAAAYASNVHFARVATDYLRAATTDINPFLHTWSLSVEEQFYLVWPMLILLAVKSKRTVLMLSVVAGLSLALCIWLTHYKQPWAFFASPTRAWEFAAGGLGLLLIKKRNNLIGWFGLAAIILAAVTYGAQTSFPGVAAVLPAVGTVAILNAGESSSLGKVLSTRLLQWIGRLSYSWYLWHWPVLVLTNASTLVSRLGWLAVSLGLAIVSYTLVENPVRRNKILRPAHMLIIAACLTLFGMGTATMWRQVREDAANSPAQARFTAASFDLPSLYKTKCLVEAPQGEHCTFGVPDSATTVALFGDSKAAQWFPAFERMAQSERWRLIVFIRQGCAPEDISYFDPIVRRRFSECEEWRALALEKIKQLRPALVVMTGSQRYSKSPPGGPSPDEYREGAKRTLQKFEEAGANVLFLRDTPGSPFNIPSCLSRSDWQASWRKPSSCTFPRQAALDEKTAALERQAAEGFKNVKYIDLADYLCSALICFPEKDGTIIYRDTHHLTVAFTTAFAPTLTEILKAQKLWPK